MSHLEDEYLWGAMFHGRGPFIIWHDSREEALRDAESVEDKHSPAELVRIPLAALELSDKFFYADHTRDADRRWHSREEALRDEELV